MAMTAWGAVVLITIEGLEYVLVCSTREKMDRAMEELAIPDACIKVITDGNDFLDSLPWPAAVDPWITPEGNTRFHMAFKSKLL